MRDLKRAIESLLYERTGLSIYEEVSFVNLKVELLDQNSYEIDQTKLLDNLKYLKAHLSGMETKELIELKFNGYKISGLSRGTIETGGTLGTF